MSIALKSTAVAAVAVATATIFAPMAHSATVSVTGVSGTWTSITMEQGYYNASYVPDEAHPTGLGTSTLTWGKWPEIEGSSSYVFGAADTPFGPAADTPFQLGTFTHNNYKIEGYKSLGATLSVVIDINIDGTPYSLAMSTDFTHEETPNTGSCPYGGDNKQGVNANGCADKVTVETNFPFSQQLKVGNTTYSFEFLGLCPDCSNPTAQGIFLTKEDSTNTAQLLARYTTYTDPNVVPLPAAGWLLLAGVGGLGLVARRRNKA